MVPSLFSVIFAAIFGAYFVNAQPPAEQLKDAILQGDISEVQSLLDAGVSPNTQILLGDELETPLTLAVRAERPEAIELLVEAGADLEARNGQRDTALIVATKNGRIDLMTTLLELGADVNGRGSVGFTPIFAAQTPLAWQLLIARGANVNVEGDEGVTPLIPAANFGELAKVRALIRAGANPNYQTATTGETALIAASGNVQVDVVKLLLEAGADVNTTNNQGETALMACFHHAWGYLMENDIERERTPELVRVLVDHGANVDARRHDGKTALDLLVEGGEETRFSREAVAKIIEQARKK